VIFSNHLIYLVPLAGIELATFALRMRKKYSLLALIDVLETP